VYQKKRPEDRIGHPHHAAGAEPAGQGGSPVTRGTSQRASITIPKANKAWRPQARSWFNSLALSGQSEFYEASDWATAVVAAQSLDIFLRTYNAAIYSQFVKLSERLAVTAIDRARARIVLEDPELPRDADEDAADEALSGWQGRLLHAVPDPK
jgi:hypothetical protein